MEGKPEYRTIRNERYNPHFEDYLREEFPTVTIKRAKRITGVNVGTCLASHYVGAGTYFLVTRLEVYADRATEFYVKDSDGTALIVYLEAAGQHTLIGDQYAPVTVLQGAAPGTLVEIRNLSGTSSGIYAACMEGIQPQFGSETV